MTTTTAEKDPLKREYFIPKYGVTVEATSVEEAIELAKQQANPREEGDG